MSSISALEKVELPTTHDGPIRVLVVEDHLVLREALIILLESSEGVVVSDSAATAEEALRKIHVGLDLVILDISLPGRDGIWLTRKIKERSPGLPVLVLTMHDQPDFVLKALESGVDGYLTKWVGRQELLQAVSSVAGNGSYLEARVAPLVVDELRRRGRKHFGSQKKNRELMLSEREREIARSLVMGLSNSEIASRISLSVSTVKAGLRSLYSKLKVTCRTEAVAVVVQKELVC
jgi:DNA-binding NarL/FixJ family response regulator